MAAGVRSLFGSGDGLDRALAIRRQSIQCQAQEYDALVGYLLEGRDEPMITRGGEQLVGFGGSGTPKVSEFAGCELGPALDMSPNAARTFIGDILDIAYRLPALHNALHEGTVDAWRVRKVASATRDFTLTQVTEADRRLSAETVGDGTPMLCRVTMKRLGHILDQIRNQARNKDDHDTDGRDGDEDDRHVRIWPVGDGLATLDGLLSAEDGHRLDQRLDQIVSWLRALGDQRTKDVLRSVAVGYLTEPDSLDLLYDQVRRLRASGDDGDGGGFADADTSAAEPDSETDVKASTEHADAADHASEAFVPDTFRRTPPRRRRLPATTVYLHLDRESGTWSMDGHGPISRDQAADIIGHTQVTLKPVIDLAQNLSYTGYVAPPKLKEQTALQNAGYCTFPYCDRPARDGDYDHLIDHADGGPTSSRNGHRLCRYHHRAKTFTNWHVQSPAPGTWLWTSPSGRSYLVTTGTTTRLDTHGNRHRRRRTNAA